MNINAKNILKNNSRNKTKFILAWYYLERKKLNDVQKMQLLNKWIKSCAVFEEFEMSNALLKQKKLLSRQIRITNVGERSLLKTLMLMTRIVIRKCVRKFKK